MKNVVVIVIFCDFPSFFQPNIAIIAITTLKKSTFFFKMTTSIRNHGKTMELTENHKNLTPNVILMTTNI